MKSCADTDPQVHDQASLWVTRIDEKVLTPNERHDFFTWLKSSPSHKLAFQELAKQHISIREMLDASPLQEPVEKTSPRRGVSFFTRVMAASAAVICIGLVGWQWHQQPTSKADAMAVEHHTRIGEQRTIPLDDGSFVILNTKSHVQIHYTATHRRLTLVAGEAYFDVQRDTDRPFEVSVDGRKVRALGTEFSIQQQPDQLEVIVTEGRIQIAIDNTSNTDKSHIMDPQVHNDLGKTKDLSAIAYLDRGQKAKLGQANSVVISELTAKETAQHLAWRQNMLIFDGESLAEVIAEVARYSDIQITLTDPSLRDLKIGGYFKAHDVTALTATIASQFNIDMRQNSAGEIILSPAAGTSSSTTTDSNTTHIL